MIYEKITLLNKNRHLSRLYYVEHLLQKCLYYFF